MNEDRWRSYQFRVTPDSIHSKRYEVEFWPNESVVGQESGGAAQPTEKGTVVTVEDQGQLGVIAFSPSPKQVADLQRGDYEEKALEAVQDYIKKDS